MRQPPIREHVVRRGESLATIAASYGLHLWNEMSRRSPGFDKNGRFPPDSLFEQLCARYL